MCALAVLVFHTKPKDWLGETFRNYLFCVEWDVKPQLSESMCADGDVLEPSSPELIIVSSPSPPQQAATEPEPMETNVPSTAADNSAAAQYMQRKLVSKTYVNDEGYMGSY